MRKALSRLMLFSVLAGGALVACSEDVPTGVTDTTPFGFGDNLDSIFAFELATTGFSGRMDEELTAKLGRPINQGLADLGRLLFFDPVLSITQDNSCAGCHAPNVSFNDPSSIAIGIDNNGIIGPDREGPHNFRRAPTVINAAFYPSLMWDARFVANSVDPFDNSQGFSFPDPEGESLSFMQHLIGAQAFTPVVSRMEMAGFDIPGTNDEIRAEIASRVDSIAEYHDRFAQYFPDVAAGDPVTFAHIGAALAEFQFTLVRMNAPIDRYARGDHDALSDDAKYGGYLFVTKGASCYECHRVSTYANETFSDFFSHVLAVPQVVPLNTNAVFDGPGHDEDFGLERVTGNPDDRYKFRTSPLRNVDLQPTFMHNGAYVCLEDAVRHHTDLYRMLADYSTDRLAPSMRGPLGPMEPVLDVAHHLVTDKAPQLSDQQFRAIIAFLHALTDPDARPDALRSLVPDEVPSGLPVGDFEFDAPQSSCN